MTAYPHDTQSVSNIKAHHQPPSWLINLPRNQLLISPDQAGCFWGGVGWPATSHPGRSFGRVNCKVQISSRTPENEVRIISPYAPKNLTASLVSPENRLKPSQKGNLVEIKNPPTFDVQLQTVSFREYLRKGSVFQPPIFSGNSESCKKTSKQRSPTAVSWWRFFHVPGNGKAHDENGETVIPDLSKSNSKTNYFASSGCLKGTRAWGLLTLLGVKRWSFCLVDHISVWVSMLNLGGVSSVSHYISTGFIHPFWCWSLDFSPSSTAWFWLQSLLRSFVSGGRSWIDSGKFC